MKFLCNTREFLQAVQLVSRAIGGQQALPILGNILLETKGDVCRVSATDLELSMITTFPATVERDGAVTVPAKALLNFVQYTVDKEVLLEVTEGAHVCCTSAHAKAMIAGEPASEYPSIAPVEEDVSVVLDGNAVLRALQLVTFASAKTTLRPALSGVYVRTEGSRLVMVATDSYRLSEYAIPIEGEAKSISCIIPTKVLEELKVVLASHKQEKSPDGQKKPSSSEKESVHFSLSRQQINISTLSVQLLSRLIDGKFPDYTQIIPKEFSTTIVFPVHDLVLSVKRLHYFAKEANSHLTFHCGERETSLSSPQTQAGKDEAILSAELSGAESRIALSSSYLLDFLGHITPDTVVMRMTDKLHPAVFTLPGEANFFHLIMPLRMQEGEGEGGK